MAKRNYGYITNKERNRRVRQSNQNYYLRKLFIILTVVALVVLVVFGILIIYNFTSAAKELQNDSTTTGQEFIKLVCEKPVSIFAWSNNGGGGFDVTLSWFGWFMAIWTAVTVGLSVVSLILILLMKSPKAAKANINRLQSAALSGKKIDENVNAAQVYHDRGTNTKKLKKAERAK